MRTLIIAIILFALAYSYTKFKQINNESTKEILEDSPDLNIPDLHDFKIDRPMFPKLKSTTIEVVDFTSHYNLFDLNKTNLIICYLLRKDSIFSFTEVDADLHEHLMYMVDENLLINQNGSIVASQKLGDIYNKFVDDVSDVRIRYEIFNSVGYGFKNGIEFGYCKQPFEQYIDIRIPVVKNYTNILIDDYIFSVLLIEGFFDPVIDDYFISKINRGLVSHNISKVKQKAFYDSSKIDIGEAYKKGLIIDEKIFN